MNPKPIDRPISFLPMFEQALKGDLADTLEQYQTLIQAKDKPYILDNATMERLIRLHEEKKEFIGYYQTQFARWRKQSLSSDQHKKLEELEKELPKLKTQNEKLLQLTYEMKDYTIDKIMDMDPAELALLELSGKFGEPALQLPKHALRFLVFTDKRCEKEGHQYSFFFKEKGSDEEIIALINEFFDQQIRRYHDLKGFGARRFMGFFINFVRDRGLNHIMGIMDFSHKQLRQEVLDLYTFSYIKLWTDKYDKKGLPLIEVVDIDPLP